MLRAISRRLAKAPFDWSDPLQLNVLGPLTDIEVAARDSARAYAQAKLMPRVTEMARHEKHDASREIFRELGELGMMAPFISGYGCAGLSYTASGLISKEIERVDSAFRSMWSVQSSLVMHPINQFASDAIKAHYLPKLASGEMVGCFGLTEPDAGSDPSAMRTTCVKRGGDWVLNGTKMWISNSPIADVAIVWAIDPTDKQTRGFVVDRSLKGVDTPAIHGKLSLRAGPTGYIGLNNVVVPDTHRLDVRGLRGPFSCLDSARFGIAWGVLGAAEFCYAASRAYAMERKMFGVLASKQLVQMKLAEMATEIALASAAVLQASRLKEKGELPHEAVSLLKRNNTLKAIAIARVARDIHGGNGICDEYHVLRVANNLESVVTYEGTADIHALILGRGITGIAAF